MTHKLWHRFFSYLLVVMILGTAFITTTPTVSLAAPGGSGTATQAEAAADPATPTSSRPVSKDGELNGGEAAVDARLSHVSGPVSIILELTDDPAVFAYAQSKDNAGLAKAAVVQNTRSQLAKVEQAQQQVLNELTKLNVSNRILYRVKNVYNGIALNVDASLVTKLSKIAGVKAVHFLPSMELTNAVSVPLIGSPEAWTSYGITGTGIKVGIIDTGIDYLHTNFAGPGTGYNIYTDTTPIAVTAAAGVFPGPRVVGGYDFVGDAYTGSNTPQPDPNPLDCNGHGSHVAGISGGSGVNADGTTYSGPYNNSIPFNSLRIGPGNAPGAELYALRVFGCTGSTNVVTEAIDYALDPNGDGDFSDHLDVINMSLGSSNGSNEGPDAVASNNASVGGIVVVASAGNANDNYYVLGTPSSATRAISVAASVDSTDVVDSFNINAPAVISGTYPANLSVAYNYAANPATTGNVVYPSPSALPADTDQTGCAPFSAAASAVISGNIVLLDWILPGETTFRCGSVARGNNAIAAHAKGVILVDNTGPIIGSSITGVAAIPEVITNKPSGDAIKGQLTPGVVSSVVATLGNFRATGKIVIPGRTDTLTDFTSRGPAIGNALKPDITAPGYTIFSTNSGTGNQGLNESGTSQASPQVAGVIALLREKNPSWTVEELKALVMNTANHDLFTGITQTSTTKYAPARIGAGRVDTSLAISNTVVAYNAGNPGAVSVSFGAVEVNSNTFTQTRTIHVVNKSNTATSYTASYISATDVPGITYSFPDGTNVNLAANGVANIRVQLNGNVSQMANVRDVTVSPTQLTADGFNQPRQWLNEASGNVVLTPASGTSLRVPVWAAVRPAGSMTTTSPTLAFNGSNTTTLQLAGTPVQTTDTTGIVTALELQGGNPDFGLTGNARVGNVKYVGVASDAKGTVAGSKPVISSTVYFGIASWGNWSIPAPYQVEYDINIFTSTAQLNGVSLFNNYIPRNDANGNSSNVYVSSLVNLTAGTLKNEAYLDGFSSASVNTAQFNNNVLVLPVKAADLRLNGATRFYYYVNSFDDQTGALLDQLGPFTYDFANPGLDATGGAPGIPTYYDLPGNTIPVSLNRTAYNANGSQGALLLHNFNVSPTQAQKVPISVFPPQLTVAPTAVSFTGQAGGSNPASQTVTLTATGGTITYTSGISYGAGASGWLTATPASGSVSTTQAVNLTANTTGLATGTYTATVTFTDVNNSSDTATTTVTLSITATPPTPILTVAPAALTFTSTVGGANPASQTVTLTASNGPITYTTSYSGALTVTASPASGTVASGGNSPVSISVNSTGLAAGTYTATVTFQDTVNAADKAVVNVTLTVTAGPPPPTVYTYYLPFLANGYNPGAPITGTFTSYLAVQNAGSGTANATISYFDSAGVTLTASTVVTTVARYGEILPANPFASGAKGAGVITSNQPLNVIVAEGTPYGGSAYAVNQGANSNLIAPLAINNNNNFVTQITVFNGGTVTTTATLTYYDQSGASPANQVLTVGPRQSATADQTNVTGLTTGFYGWAAISSTVGSQLVAQVLEQRPDIKFVAIANAQPAPQTTLYAPAIFNNAYGGFFTGANIVNPASTPVTVSISYYDLGGTRFAATPFVLVGRGVQQVFQGSGTGNGIPAGGLPANFVGAAVITSTGGGVNMVVNEVKPVLSGSQSGVYAAASSGSSNLGLPVIAKNGFGYTTGTTVFNASPISATFTLTYYKLDGTALTTPAPHIITVAAHASVGVYQGDDLLSDFYGTAVLVQTSGGSTLIDTTNAINGSAGLFYTYTEPAQ